MRCGFAHPRVAVPVEAPGQRATGRVPLPSPFPFQPAGVMLLVQYVRLRFLVNLGGGVWLCRPFHGIWVRPARRPAVLPALVQIEAILRARQVARQFLRVKL